MTMFVSELNQSAGRFQKDVQVAWQRPPRWMQTLLRLCPQGGQVWVNVHTDVTDYAWKIPDVIGLQQPHGKGYKQFRWERL